MQVLSNGSLAGVKPPRNRLMCAPALTSAHFQGLPGVANRRRSFPARDAARLTTTCQHIITFNSSTQSTRLRSNIKHRLENAAPFPSRACHRSGIWGRDDAALPQLPVPPSRPQRPCTQPCVPLRAGRFAHAHPSGDGLREPEAGACAFQKSCDCSLFLTYK